MDSGSENVKPTHGVYEVVGNRSYPTKKLSTPYKILKLKINILYRIQVADSGCESVKPTRMVYEVVRNRSYPKKKLSTPCKL